MGMKPQSFSCGNTSVCYPLGYDDDLEEENEDLEVRCTPYSGVYCPVCGDCSCTKTPKGVPCFDAVECPLHGTKATHAKGDSYHTFRQETLEEAEEQEVLISPNDLDIITRFKQQLQENSSQLQHVALTPEALALLENLQSRAGGTLSEIIYNALKQYEAALGLTSGQ